MNKDGHLAFGLVGCGHIGKRHAELIGKYGRLVAVCDVNEEKANHFASTYNTKPYLNFQLLLEKEKDLDVIVICTPNALHAGQAIAALNQRLHVLCEKPMALKLFDCDNMIEAAMSNKRILHIVKQNRYNQPVIQLKHLLSTGSFGKIYSISLQCYWNRKNSYYTESNWKGLLSMDGGILYTQFSHFIDIACWMFGKMECIAAYGANYAHKQVIEFEDTIIALVKFEHEVVGTFHFSINAHEQNMEGSLTVLGEKGSMTIGGQYLNKLTYFNVQDKVPPAMLAEGNENDYGAYKGSMNNHENVYVNLTNAIKNGLLNHDELSTSLLTIDAIKSIKTQLNN